MPSKRELDKQNMFRKIMPSAAAAAAAPSSSGANLSPEEISALLAANAAAPQPQQPAPVPSGDADKKLSTKDIAAIYAEKHIEVQNELEAQYGQQANTPMEPEYQQEQQPVHAPPAVNYAPEPEQTVEYIAPTPEPEPAENTISAPDEEPYPVNIAALLVQENYPRYAKRLNACGCEKCREHACGIALNQMQPRYVPSDELPNVDLTERELVTETVTALMRAIFIVSRNPPH